MRVMFLSPTTNKVTVENVISADGIADSDKPWKYSVCLTTNNYNIKVTDLVSSSGELLLLTELLCSGYVDLRKYNPVVLHKC